MSSKADSSPVESGSNTAKSSQRKKRKQGGKGKPFKARDPVTGEIDPRTNLKGRPRMFDEVRSLLEKIFHEELDVHIGSRTEKQSQIEFMLRNWVLSQDFNKQNRALEYAAGKVPDELTHSFDIDGFIQNNISILTDGQLTRIRNGEDPAKVLAEVMQDVQALLKKK